ncbi:hypothetical protein PTSG_07739 [Salpingoeca rosetta]|uniref:Uncharacterized protein n=1 Tax=Salpingoeca rosetta (strain ATCC 50818 / BSB-021) TaxID=946362 RepID=F2UHM7_SALR5|nr:uncharacterized protein PTSG_07739 [Salpingoeca rosetta]EGD76626.1 hypothetical protein PTSG_07739 [Salpingoeca rosetta]|eukprot:XP_004991540.1 hypothetical protein PTSG_07739 [Salpingoeca rosetta]
MEAELGNADAFGTPKQHQVYARVRRPDRVQLDGLADIEDGLRRFDRRLQREQRKQDTDNNDNDNDDDDDDDENDGREGFVEVARPLPPEFYAEATSCKEHVRAILVADPPRVTMQPRSMHAKRAMLEEACKLRHPAICVQIVKWLYSSLNSNTFVKLMASYPWAITQFLNHLRRRQDMDTFTLVSRLMERGSHAGELQLAQALAEPMDMRSHRKLELLLLTEPPGSPIEEHVVYIQDLCARVTCGAQALSDESAALTLNACTPALIHYRVPTETAVVDINANVLITTWSRAIGLLDQQLPEHLDALLAELNTASFPLLNRMHAYLARRCRLHRKPVKDAVLQVLIHRTTCLQPTALAFQALAVLGADREALAVIAQLGEHAQFDELASINHAIALWSVNGNSTEARVLLHAHAHRSQYRDAITTALEQVPLMRTLVQAVYDTTKQFSHPGGWMRRRRQHAALSSSPSPDRAGSANHQPSPASSSSPLSSAALHDGIRAIMRPSVTNAGNYFSQLLFSLGDAVGRPA